MEGGEGDNKPSERAHEVEGEMVSGACNCGNIQISIPKASCPLTSVTCHCLGCKASSGSLFSVIMPMPSSEVKIIKGMPKLYLDHDTGSGRPLQRFFCGDCGSAIISMIPTEPETTYVKGGLFAKTGVKLPKPAYETWFSRKEEWEVAIEGSVVVG